MHRQLRGKALSHGGPEDVGASHARLRGHAAAVRFLGDWCSHRRQRGRSRRPHGQPGSARTETRRRPPRLAAPSSALRPDRYGKRTTAAAVLPASTFTVFTLRPCSGCTNTMVCGPGATLTPDFGVAPSGRPSRMTLATGMALMLSVPLPEAAAPPDLPPPLGGTGLLPPLRRRRGLGVRRCFGARPCRW